jgi:glycosyltransferase involved in cell wall biosynthesis
MTIAVALATYNGERFLQEQLDSLAKQTRLPDQLVIRDDGSTDATLDIVDAFRRSAPFPVEVLSAGEKLGPMMNFLTAAQACRAEYVAFCDQDDIWLPTKLERCEAALMASGACLAIHSVSNFRDVGGRRVWEDSIDVPTRTVDGLQFTHNAVIFGMAMVISKEVLLQGVELREVWLSQLRTIVRSRPISRHDHWAQQHDTYALVMARMLGAITFLGETLAWRRLHENNASDMRGPWKQAPEIASMWGNGRGVFHRIVSNFCAEFAAFVRNAPSCGVASEARCNAAAHAYEKWAAILLARSKLLADDASLSDRLTNYREAIALGAYRSEYAGGMGYRSFVKDSLNVLGVKVG